MRVARQCGDCGRWSRGIETTCRDCGAALPAVETVDESVALSGTEAPPADRGKYRPWIVVGVIVVALMIVGGAVSLFFASRGDTSDIADYLSGNGVDYTSADGLVTLRFPDQPDATNRRG